MPLSDTQLILLSEASQSPDRRIVLPESLRGGAATKVLESLARKGLIEPILDPEQLALPGHRRHGLTDFQITSVGLMAINADDDGQREQHSTCVGSEVGPGSEVEDAGDESGSVLDAAGRDGSAVPRAGTKLADVIALLEREGGASIDELIAATGWLAHTTRAAVTGLRKRGLVVDRVKREDGTTVYRIEVVGKVETAGETS